ncbi:MAG: hypothetical protein AAB018_02515 [Actinomycetota bacterium]
MLLGRSGRPLGNRRHYW